MDEVRVKRLCVKRSYDRIRSDDRIEKVDRLSSLPDSLIFEVLLKLPTQDVIRTSLLSRRWRNFWKHVRGLDMDSSDFLGSKAFVNFFDRFLDLTNGSCLQKFKSTFNCCIDYDHIRRWIDIAITRKVQHLNVWESSWLEVEILPTIYTCESLVTLNLHRVMLPHPEFVTLPSLKVINLELVKFANDLAFETLISGCPVLESLTLTNCGFRVLRVCSQSLVNFTVNRCHNSVGMDIGIYDRVVVIDGAPRLEYLKLHEYLITSVKTNNTGSLVKVDIINIPFDLPYIKTFNPNSNLSTRNMIQNFLIGISSVKTMNISSDTLKVIYGNLRYEGLPVFRNLSFLRINFDDYMWEVLQIFLESCPNLKSLSLKFCKRDIQNKIRVVPGPRPRQFLTLEYFKIEDPMYNEAVDMELASYILENSTFLKKFTICLASYKRNKKSAIVKKLLSIPRLSTSCKFWVL